MQISLGWSPAVAGRVQTSDEFGYFVLHGRLQDAIFIVWQPTN
jgi:hypothetical protein